MGPASPPHPEIRGVQEHNLSIAFTMVHRELIVVCSLAAVALLPLVCAGVDMENSGSYKTFRPVVGVLTQPTDNKKEVTDGYVMTDYIRFLEGAGARVVPIHFALDKETLSRQLRMVHGVLYPGGPDYAANSTFVTHARFVYEEAKKLNLAGTVFPVWGTCLGHELISKFQADDYHLLKHRISETKALSLDLTKDAPGSTLLSGATTRVINTLSKTRSTLNFHQWGVTPEDFNAHKGLSSFFKVVATSKDDNGDEFVALQEGIDLPVFTSQFHPEKNAYEWVSSFDEKMDPIEFRGLQAVEAMQHFANVFVDIARKSPNQFPETDQGYKWLAYNYKEAACLGVSEARCTYVSL